MDIKRQRRRVHDAVRLLIGGWSVYLSIVADKRQGGVGSVNCDIRWCVRLCDDIVPWAPIHERS